MDSSKNMLCIDFASNERLEAMLGGKNIGDEGELEIKYSVAAKPDGGIHLSVIKITVEGEPEESKDVAPSDDQPIMAVMRNKRKSNPSVKGPPQPIVNSDGGTSYA